MMDNYVRHYGYVHTFMTQTSWVDTAEKVGGSRSNIHKNTCLLEFDLRNELPQLWTSIYNFLLIHFLYDTLTE